MARTAIAFRAAFSRILQAVFRTAFADSYHRVQHDEEWPVHIDQLTSGASCERTPEKVTISRWVNEPVPDFRKILSSRDVARLTRRPRWLLIGLTLIRRFPRQQRYRGRPIGWQRLEVLEWLTRGLEAANDDEFGGASTGGDKGVQRRSRQACLPFECGESCPAMRQPAVRSRRRSISR